MKIFVATKETQGQRANDFCFCDEGEVVTVSVLTCPRETTDGPCGCKRSLGGVGSSKGTTTARVVDFAGDLAAEIQAALQRGGWEPALRSLPAYAQQCAVRLLTVAARFPVGTVVEYRSGTFQRRPRRGERETL